MAVKYFLKNYPEYAKNDFYITGESYGGVYVPTLAVKVMQDSQINFKVKLQFPHSNFTQLQEERIDERKIYYQIET